MVAKAAALLSAGILLRGLQAAAAARLARAQATFQGDVAERNAEQTALLLERNADLAERDAEEEAAFLEFDIETQRRLFARGFATTRARIGASGTEFSGSNLLVAIDQAREAELAIDVLRVISERRQAGFRDDAALARFGAEQARAGGAFAQDVARSTRRNIQRSLPLTLAATAVGGAAPMAPMLLRSGGSQRRTGTVAPGTGERLQ